MKNCCERSNQITAESTELSTERSADAMRMRQKLEAADCSRLQGEPTYTIDACKRKLEIEYNKLLEAEKEAGLTEIRYSHRAVINELRELLTNRTTMKKHQ